MQNPLAIFSTDLLQVLLNQGFTLFVRQSYPRGKDHFDTEIKEAVLITPYKDIGLANQHFQYIRFDPRKHIYQIHRPEELERLRVASSQPQGYKVYVALLAEKTWKASVQLNAKITTYIRLNTKWKARDRGVNADLFLHYGDLMLHINNGSEEIKIPLSEVERL